MKTVEIKLRKSVYKDIKNKADKHEFSVADFILRMCRNQINEIERGIMLDDMIDQALFELDTPDEIMEKADEINTFVEFKAQDAIEYLEKNEEE